MNENNEIYRQILDFPSYSVSNFGNIKNNNTNLILKQNIDNGYYRVHLYDKTTKKRKKFSVHRLIALNFIDNPCNYPVVDHIDRNKQNNSLDNLRLCTYRQNNLNKTILKKGHIVKRCNLYTFIWYDNGKRFSKTFSSLEEAKKHQDEYKHWT